MISYEQAYSRMMAAACPLPTETIPLSASLGRICAADVHADINLPPFNKSAMDGYACRRQDLSAGAFLEIIEEIPAGAWPQLRILKGTCARILTGAPVPDGANCVLMQEQTERVGARIKVVTPETSTNICLKGEDAKQGDLLVRKGELLTPAHIAVLATVGIAEPIVASRPKVAIFATGSELIEPHLTPVNAQIRNSNAWQLRAHVESTGAIPDYRGIVGDREDELRKAFLSAMDTSEFLLISGGVASGDFDLVPAVLQKLGFVFEFDSVAIQPGKSIIFGRKGNCYCFGLPGNPVSTYVIFELMVKPFLYRLMRHELKPRVIRARLTKAVNRRKTTRQSMIPVRFGAGAGEVEPVDYHGSAHINAITLADGLLSIPLGSSGFAEGDIVDVRLLPA